MSVTVNSGQTVAIREVAMNIRQDTVLVKIGIPSMKSLDKVAAAPMLQPPIGWIQIHLTEAIPVYRVHTLKPDGMIF